MEFGSSKIKREVRVHGVDVPVTVEMSETGLTFWVKGSRKKTTLSWTAAAKASSTQADVPSFLMGEPIKLLQHQASK